MWCSGELLILPAFSTYVTTHQIDACFVMMVNDSLLCKTIFHNVIRDNLKSNHLFPLLEASVYF